MNGQPTGWALLAGRFGRTLSGMLRNRGELLAVEWQEEKHRLLNSLVWMVGLLFLGMMGVLMLTATILYLFPAERRIYAAAAFAVVYGIGAVLAWISLKKSLKQEPFAASLDQLKKDALWLESLK